jgi:glycine/D-amino acid oxidase-like deaminating enzyme
VRALGVVIGGGAFGGTCFYHLTARGGGRDVVLREQGTLGSGSTECSATVVETQYLARDQVALCAWSMRVFRWLARVHGWPFFHHGDLRLGHSAADVGALWAWLTLALGVVAGGCSGRHKLGARAPDVSDSR